MLITKLEQADTVNPFDRDVSLRPGNLYANLVLAESEQVLIIDNKSLMRMNDLMNIHLAED